MAAKSTSFGFLFSSISLLLFFGLPFLPVVTSDVVDNLLALYDNQLLNVNASWPSGAELMEQDCCDGNTTDPTSLTPFLAGPPTVYVKANHDDSYPESFIQATNKSLLSSKYLVMLTLYNQTTQSAGVIYQPSTFLWIQGNMTASTPGGIISDNNTFATLSSSTEPLISYSMDASDLNSSLSDPLTGFRFDQSIWQFSVGVYQQTPELEDFLYANGPDGMNPEQNQTLLHLAIANMFDQLSFGQTNPSTLWNSDSVSPWGRVYCDVPGVFDSVATSATAKATATPTASGSSTKGGSTTSPTASSSGSSTKAGSAASATAKSAAIKTTVFAGASRGLVFLFQCIILPLSVRLFI